MSTTTTKATHTPANPIPLVDTTNMDNEKWLAIREHGLGEKPTDPDYIPYTITGSGASSALGVNPWVSDAEYRDLKMGIKPVLEVKFNEESKAAGHVFEPFVAINFLRFMKQNFPDIKVNLIKDCMRDILPYLRNASPDSASYEKFVDSQDKIIAEFNKKWDINPSYMYQCGIKDSNGELKYPFALANIDGLVELSTGKGKKRGIFEAKTTSSKSTAVREYWEQGKIPPYYYWQLVFYMAVMNLDFAYITCCWGMTLSDMAVILLERDLNVETQFMEFLATFVEDMELGTPLEESKSDPELVAQYYSRLYGPATESKKGGVELPPHCKELVLQAIDIDEKIAAAEAEVKKLKAEKAKVYNQIHPIMKSNAYATITMDDDRTFGIKMKPSMKRAEFDTERFKEEQPELFDRFSTIVVDTSGLEAAHKGMKKKYQLPQEPNPKGTASFEIYRYGDGDGK